MKAIHAALVVVALGAAVACRATHVAPAQVEAGVSPAVAESAAPAPATVAPGPRWSLLGRVTDLGRFDVLHTLCDPPVEEVTVPANDTVLVRTRDLRITAFRLSTGERLWEQTPESPCRGLLVAGASVYAGCGDQVVARAIDTGQATVVDPGPGAMDPIIDGSSIISLHQDGRVNVYDLGTGQRRASATIRELGRAFRQHVIANPSSDGVCVLGLVSMSAKRFAYRAGCYDDRLIPRWTRTLPMVLPRDPVYDLRQLGPRHVVLDDQSSPVDPSLPSGPGAGLALRWRDGLVTPFDDGTFATLEDSTGERLPATPDDVFHRARDLAGAHATPGVRQAQIASDDKHTFALIQNGGFALAGIDRSTNRPLFVVSVPGTRGSRLEIAAGMPVIRSQFEARWLVTVHDPATGKLLYQDAR